MNESTTDLNGAYNLRPYLSKLEVWALSVGSAIGFGSIIVMGNEYLLQAGPLGSIIGLLIGLAMMLMVANHYTFLANRYPGTGGLYNYVKYIFGYDRAFLVAWFMFLIYISIFWANATSVPLFIRYFIGNGCRVGYLYTVFGYDVYLGEAIVTMISIALVALLCIKSKKMTARVMVLMVLIFTVGITVCFVAAMMGNGAEKAMSPAFIPDKSAFRQVLRIAFVSPWAFIGFESISHSAAECKFKHRSMFKILTAALLVITALYIFAVLLSASAYPESCTSWLDYLSRLDEFDGLASLPAFYAANHYMGNTGVAILMASVLTLVLSSLIGLLRALSRLCYAVAQDDILPKRFSKLNKKQIPVNTIILVMLISLPIPFLGRTASGWIVDTTTIGATILYGFATAAVFKVSRKEKKKKDIVISGICLFILVAFMLFLLMPELFGDYTIQSETYFLMTMWAFLGIIFFNRVIRKDHARNFGKAIIVWLALLAFIVLMTMTWVERINESKEDVVVSEIMEYYNGTADSSTLQMNEEEFMGAERKKLHDADNTSAIVITVLFGLSLGVMLINYLSIRRWEKKAADERDHARVIAFTDPLTGVKSKHAFSVSEGEMELLIAEGNVKNFGVVVCDVNGLKKINDTLGHKAGDEYIRSACVMLCDYFKHSPVFRIGGDEFVVLLQGHDYDERYEIMRCINEQIEKNIGTNEVVASLGMAEYDSQNDQSFYDVFSRADGLMYERKLELKCMGAVVRD
ncbi:MAG: amino acid permease [Clostridia bacterium]|nr:amino acid permease [Clostridia bacterium]